MENKIITFLILILVTFPLISSDIILQEVNETSGITLDKKLDIELREAEVELIFNEQGGGNLKATFNVYSNEKEKVNTIVYLKAKGRECYGFECEDINFVEETFFNINSPYNHNTLGPENGEFTSDTAEIYETEEGKFASVNFILKPGINEIKIYQPIYAPFEYYLDSLSTFKKADYERITIKGPLEEVLFNEYYPVEKISDNEWLWEYSNLNVADENLKDVLIIKKINSPNLEPNKLIHYLFGFVILIVLAIIVFLIKRRL